MAILAPDLCVIGASPAGASLAMAATAFGASVVIVDNGEFAAGPPFDRHAALAALVAAGDGAEMVRSAAAFGLKQAEHDVDFRSVARRMQRVAAATAASGSAERLAAAGIRVIRSTARFVDQRTLSAGDLSVRARRFVIATGSKPRVPAVPGIGQVETIDLEGVSKLTRRPTEVVVLGDGPEAVAAAQALRRLGSGVTLVASGAVLSGFDGELVALLRALLRKGGVELLEDTAVTGVERRGKWGVRAHLQAGSRLWSVDATHLLLAAGDVPQVDGLDLASAGATIAAGSAKAPTALSTGNRRIFAIGDAAGEPVSLPRSSRQVGILVRSILFRRSSVEDLSGVPRLVMTDPQLAQVGLDEDAARARRGELRILRWPFAENVRALSEERTDGHIKVVADAKGRILGASILGRGAAEAIGIWSLAIERGLSVADMAGWSPAAPSFGEIGKSAAMPYLAEMARRPSLRRMVRFMRLLG